MEDGGQIILVGNDSDILHSGFSHAISDGGKRYPSVNHYAHSMILSRLGLDDSVLLDLLCASTRDVASKAQELLLSHMPSGHDMNSLGSYLQSSRHSYTMQGLRIRVQQDKAFERALLDTKESLLIVCDSKDRELGIGMEEHPFAEWMSKERVDAAQIAYWMRNEIGRPPHLGANQLGYFLMWLRHEVVESKKQEMLQAKAHSVDGLSRDQNEKPVKMQVNDLVISLTGVFRPLSNYYPMRFELKGDTYRSVEHYAYEKLFVSLKLDDKCIEKLTTTVLPVDVPLVAHRIFKSLNIASATIDSKQSKLDRWRQSAMKHKLVNNEYLQQLLLSTGDALLVDCADGDPAWTCGGTEAELQRLLGKDYVNAEKLVGWMRDKEDKVPRSVRSINGNKTGLLLMELRARLAGSSPSRIPLISPMDLTLLSSQVTPHMICLTPESVFHPLYPAEICPSPGMPLLPSPAHYVAQQAIKAFTMNKPDSEYIMEDRSSLVCWQRMHEVLETRSPDMEKDTQWWMVKRQQAIREALTLLLEQHTPLLRALLETHDALLVYCARFSSTEAELGIGMRECDLRMWMQHVGLDTKQLMELCSRPLAFRPPYLGGNRLGLILMELRREFVLRGFFPNALPDLPIGPESILGSDSPTENLMVGEHFDILAPENYTDVVVNPLLLLAKETKNSELQAAAFRQKVAPRMVSLDDERIASIVDDIESMAGKVDVSYLAECAPEELRGVFVRLCGRLRAQMAEADGQQNEMNDIARGVSQMQFMRRGLEEAKAAHTGIPPDGPPFPPEGRGEMGGPPTMGGGGPPSTNIMNGGAPAMRGMGGGPDRSPMGRRAQGGGDRDGGRFENGRGPPQGPPRRRHSPDRKLRGDLIPPLPPRRGMSPRRQRDPPLPLPSQSLDRSPAPKRPRKSPTPPSMQQQQQAPTPEPAKPKVKAPRPADDELSDGEILDSDED